MVFLRSYKSKELIFSSLHALCLIVLYVVVTKQMEQTMYEKKAALVFDRPSHTVSLVTNIVRRKDNIAELTDLIVREIWVIGSLTLKRYNICRAILIAPVRIELTDMLICNIAY
jgi:hypothetical protein